MIRTEQVAGLMGKRVELVCFAQYSAYVHLEGGVILTVEAGFEHTHEGTSDVHEFSAPVSGSRLMRILENTVTEARIGTNGDLYLTMSSGDTIRVYKADGFESYRLKIAGQELIP